MGRASDIGLGSIVLGVEGIEVLFQALVGGDPAVDGAANMFCSSSPHDAPALFDGLSRRPKNRGPFQRVPVMAWAIFDRLGQVLAFQAKPSAHTTSRSIPPSPSRASIV